jgi:hypothetical protein
MSRRRKKYTNKCNFCDFKAIADKRYTAIQSITKHKDICCKKVKCEECDFRPKDRIDMKRHMRDIHEVMSSSTSPPLTRKRKIKEQPSSDFVQSAFEPMDVEEHGLEDLSLSFEDMDIESQEVLQQRSKFNDEKVLEKERRNDEADMLLRRRKMDDLEQKKKVDQKKLERIKIESKKQKQKRKVLKKKSKTKIALSDQIPKIRVPNIRDIPMNCKHLLKDDDVLYVVPGDGCCGPNCGAAFLFQDEVYGPKLCIQMNKFVAKHWQLRYKLITKCSKKTPFIRKLGGGEVKFTDPKKLIKFLENS